MCHVDNSQTWYFRSKVSGKLVKIFIGKATGDKTGILLALRNTRIYVESHSVRTEAPVNYQADTGGQIVFPIQTTLLGTRAPALTVNGEIHGIEELRLSSNVGSLVTEKGFSACLDCHSNYTSDYIGHYWFKKLQVNLGGTFEVQSSVQTISSQAVRLHMGEIALDYTGSLKADAAKLLTEYFSLEFDAATDASSSGWSSQQGPGSSTTCSGVAGAGHGGRGGTGYFSGCTSCTANG